MHRIPNVFNTPSGEARSGFLYRWMLKQHSAKPHPDVEIEDLGISLRLARLLQLRGYNSQEEMDRFLSPGLRHLLAPRFWPGLEQAAVTLAEALASGKKPAIWGDYDVDGITATAIMTLFLKKRGYDPIRKIPHRLTEGYGLNRQGIEKLHLEGAEILLTVDCGISDLEAVERARELGMTVIITDHHLPGEVMPNAHAVFNPRFPGSPCADLCGAGAAFMLVAAVNRMLPGEPCDVREYLDLAALGTIADVVRLTGQNRILVKNGLLMLSKGDRPGIRALKEIRGLSAEAKVDAQEVNFGLAPRINAAGRMGNPEIALHLLLTEDYREAAELAAELNRHNEDRRAEEERIITQAEKMASEYSADPAFTLYSSDWHEGVIGIAAARICERWYRPCLVLTSSGEKFKGSGRSIREFDLFKGLCSCADLLIGFGGHKRAAGLSVKPENLDALRARFNQAVRESIGDACLEPSIQLDMELGFGDINPSLLQEIDMLRPFGPGNPEPLFVSPPVLIRRHSIFADRHVLIEARDEAAGATLRAKAWRQANVFKADVVGKNLFLAYTPTLNYYEQTVSVELNVKDWSEIGN